MMDLGQHDVLSTLVVPGRRPSTQPLRQARYVRPAAIQLQMEPPRPAFREPPHK